MDYLTRADLDGYVPPSIQAQLTDDDAGTVVNESRLAEAISTASEVADGYLRQRYRLPLLVVPKQLKDWVGAIARHWLYMRRPEGANDLPMMGAAGLSVAFHAKPKVREQAMVAINEGGLERLLALLN